MQARFHLGRILYQMGQNIPRAVDELRAVAATVPNEPRVLFYLGQALRRLIETDMVPEAAAVLQAYLDKGAPLGPRKEIINFLSTSQPSNKRQAHWVLTAE